MYNRNKVTKKLQISRQLKYRPELKMFLAFILALFLIVIPISFIWVLFNAQFGAQNIIIFSLVYFSLVVLSFYSLLTGRLRRTILLPINWSDGDIGFNLSILSILIITFFMLPFTLWNVLSFMPDIAKTVLIVIFYTVVYTGLQIVFKR